jgi:hypothetical protein
MLCHCLSRAREPFSACFEKVSPSVRGKCSIHLIEFPEFGRVDECLSSTLTQALPSLVECQAAAARWMTTLILPLRSSQESYKIRWFTVAMLMTRKKAMHEEIFSHVGDRRMPQPQPQQNLRSTFSAVIVLPCVRFVPGHGSCSVLPVWLCAWVCMRQRCSRCCIDQRAIDAIFVCSA